VAQAVVWKGGGACVNCEAQNSKRYVAQAVFWEGGERV